MKIAQLFLVAAAVTVVGCSESGRERTDPSLVRVFNVTPRFETMNFYREARLEFSPAFLQTATLRFDSGPYDFRLEHVSITTGRVVDQEFALDLSPDLDYMFMIAAPNDQPETVVASWPKAFSSTTHARFSFAHASPPLGAVDVYVVPPGTDLSTTARQGMIAFRDSTTPFEVPAGPTRIYLTTAGNPADVVYESIEFDIQAGRQAFVVLSEGGNEFVKDLVVTDIFGSQPARIFAADEMAAFRVIQSVNDRFDRDVLLDQISPPLYSALPFGQVPDYAPVAAGPHLFSLTPVGNSGAIEYIEDFAGISGREHTVLFAGDSSAGIDGAMLVEDKRSIIGQATVWFLNGAGLFDSCLVYVTAPGTDLTTVEPTAILDAPEISPRLRYAPNTFELTVLDTVTGATLLGPQALTLEDGGVYSYLLVNSAGGSTVDLIRLDDPAGP